ncbi:MAG: hypothetical protein LH479_05890 [Polaromonas sp.]|nr:hypothetical protein [Polaromonas sp.]
MERLADEPRPTSEPDLPSDGADEIGEAMIRNLPRRIGPDSEPLEPTQTKENRMATDPNVPPPEPLPPLSTPPEPGEVQPTPLPT